MNTEEISDRFDIQDTVTRLAWGFDHHHWNALRDLLADDVVVDYTALFGGDVETVPAAEQVRRW